MSSDAAAISVRRRSAIRLGLCYWVTLGLLFSLRSSLGGIATTAPLLVSRAIVLSVGFGSCVLIWLVLERLNRWHFWQRVMIGCLLTLAAAVIFTAAANLAPRIIIGWTDFEAIEATYVQIVPVGGHYLPLRRFILQALEWLPLFLAWSGFALSQLYSFDVSDRERQVRQLQSLSYEAQLRAMRYQVDPHFLFNALNSISAMVLVRRNEVAEGMLLRLSSFFRQTLSIDPTEDIPLEREIGLQLQYLEVERLRFPELRIEVDLPDQLGLALVPSFILQPLVENAIKHGVGDEAGKDVVIRIAAGVEGGRLRLTVSDDGDGSGIGKPSLGLGLRNVRERLTVRFGEPDCLRTESPANGGFVVTLWLPLNLAWAKRARAAYRSTPDAVAPA